nr:glycerol-3-phosphate dehydrogenase, mitochondrial [Zonotrichia albicollis]
MPPKKAKIFHYNIDSALHFEYKFIHKLIWFSGNTGLKTALLERDDFSSGTSSRSTKLIHGGVRYLQKAIMRLDFEQYRMVKEALEERAHLLQSAPHLSGALPIMLPIYKWWQLPYYWIGIKLYDLVAGRQCLKSSYVLTKSRALELFPMLRRDKLVGAIVYYDGAWPVCCSGLCLWASNTSGAWRWYPGSLQLDC